MANLKNITELPMAESADGLNLIVNDNGAAKQIAASAVSVQADWNQNDPAKPDYVKNRPFYEAEDGEVHKIPEKYLSDGIGGIPGLDAILIHDVYNGIDRSRCIGGDYEKIKAKIESGDMVYALVVRSRGAELYFHNVDDIYVNDDPSHNSIPDYDPKALLFYNGGYGYWILNPDNTVSKFSWD